MTSDFATLLDCLHLFYPPENPAAAVCEMVGQLYGFEPELASLSGERDQNFIVTLRDANRAILKISNTGEVQAYTDFLASLLAYLAGTSLGRLCPRIMPTVQGDLWSSRQFKDGQTCAVRLVSYLEGTPIAHSLASIAEWAEKIGALQGQMCLELEGFDHPGASEFMPWNALSPDILNNRFLDRLGPEYQTLLLPHLDRLRSSLSRLRSLPTQVIHNDMHAGNILLDDAGEISGIIDFGDAIRGPVVQELAVSATSMVETLPGAWDAALNDLVHGFCAARPLSPEEVDLLHDAMVLRSVLSVGLGRAKDQLANPDGPPRAATTASEIGFRAILDMRPDPTGTGPFERFVHVPQ